MSKESFSQLYKLDLQIASANCLLALKTDIAIMGKVEKETFQRCCVQREKVNGRMFVLAYRRTDKVSYKGRFTHGNMAYVKCPLDRKAFLSSPLLLRFEK